LRGGLSTSYSASVVTGGSSAGLVALRVAPGLISNAFFNSDSTAASQGSEGTPLTTAQMRQGSSFTGFDFGSRWFIDEVVGFPGLQEKKENELILAGSEGWRMSVNAKMSKQRDIGTIPKAPIQVLQAKTASSERFVLRIQGGTAVSNEQDMSLPTEVALQQNYPNPFNPGTTINYQINVQTRVRLEVFDLLGRKVATLVNNEPQQAGYYSVRFDATALSSGIYLYRLETGSKVLLKKMTVIK